MSLRKGALSVTVEGYARSSGSYISSDTSFSLHVGARSFVSLEGTSRSVKRFRTVIAELYPAEEDLVTLDVVDNDVADSDADVDNHGSAMFSLASVCKTGSDSLEVPVISKKSNEKIGVVSLSLTWSPVEPTISSAASAETVATNTSCYPSSSSFPSSPLMTTAACPGGPANGAITATCCSHPEVVSPPRLFVPFSKDAEALPAVLAGDQKGNDVSRHERSTEIQFAEPKKPLTAPAAFGSPSAFAVLEAEAAAPRPFAMPAPDTAAGFGSPFGSAGLEVCASVPTVSGTSSAPATDSAASAAVLAAMAALAAMVAAAAELPATYCSSAAACRGAPLQSGTSVSLYPRIQPYDAAPPLEFGPGVLPTSSGAKAFYPDITVRMQISDLSMRLHELRPTLSAPLRFGGAS